MRPKAHTVALRSLACVLLCSAPLSAKPTRLAARDSARKLVLTPSSREAFRPGATHRSAHIPVTAHRPGKLAHTVTPASSHARSAATSRSASQSPVLNRAESQAQASYAAADSATLDRVHAWELTHRNPPASTPHADLPEPDPSSDTPQTLVADKSNASSNLLLPTPELDRIKSIQDEASTPVILPSLYDLRGRLVVPAPLYGSREVLLRQNQMADRDGLIRVQDDADLLDLRREKKLVALPVNEALRVDDRLPANRRFSRPWTADFLAVLAHDYYASFHEPLQVNSAVRTVEFQRHLLRTNGNAAPAAGDTASPHLTGQAVDIAKRGLTLPEIAWMRTYLQPLIEQGKIDVEEEFQQSCFHISVYRNYLPPAPAHITVAATHPPQSDASY